MRFISCSAPASGQGWEARGGDRARVVAVAAGGPGAYLMGLAFLTARSRPARPISAGGPGLRGPRGLSLPTCVVGREAMSLGKARAATAGGERAPWGCALQRAPPNWLEDTSKPGTKNWGNLRVYFEQMNASNVKTRLCTPPGLVRIGKRMGSRDAVGGGPAGCGPWVAASSALPVAGGLCVEGR